MTKNTLIGIIAAVLVAGGGAAAFVLTRPDDTASNNNQTASHDDHADHEDQQTHEQQPTEQTTSIGQFMSAGENKECTYTDAESKGTMYFANGERLRMDYQGTGTDASSGSMIVTNSKQYVWSNGQKQGITFAFNKDQTAQNQSDTNSIDTKKEYTFTCKNWTVDESKFTPPNDVTFQDFSSLMNR